MMRPAGETLGLGFQAEQGLSRKLTIFIVSRHRVTIFSVILKAETYGVMSGGDSRHG